MDGISPIAATLISVFTAAIGVLAGYLIRKSIAEAKISSAEEEAARILEEAQKQAEAKKRESLVEAREEVHKMRAEFERELRERRIELQRMERRILQKEELLDRKSEQLEKKENALERREREIEKTQAEAESFYRLQKLELERIGGLTAEQAREQLLREAEKEIVHERPDDQGTEQQARDESDRRAREIITQAIQRCADHVAELRCLVALPNDR